MLEKLKSNKAAKLRGNKLGSLGRAEVQKLQCRNNRRART